MPCGLFAFRLRSPANRNPAHLNGMTDIPRQNLQRTGCCVLCCRALQPLSARDFLTDVAATARVRQVVRQRPAKPLSAVRFRHARPKFQVSYHQRGPDELLHSALPPFPHGRDDKASRISHICLTHEISPCNVAARVCSGTLPRIRINQNSLARCQHRF